MRKLIALFVTLVTLCGWSIMGQAQENSITIGQPQKILVVKGKRHHKPSKPHRPNKDKRKHRFQRKRLWKIGEAVKVYNPNPPCTPVSDGDPFEE